MKKKVLFICIHNSARSQMAEAWLNKICGDFFAAQSAGLEPGILNPLVVEVMREVGIDLSKKGTQRVFDVWKSGELFAYVITVCDESSAEQCPFFRGRDHDCIGAFPILLRSSAVARKSCEPCARSAMKFARRSRHGARKSVR